MVQKYVQFSQSRKESGIPPYFEYDFLRKIFLMLYSINLPNKIIWLHLLLEILVIVCIVIICSPARDITNFEIKLCDQAIFLHDQKNQNKSLNIFRTKKRFRWNKKALFIIFEGSSVTRNCLKPKSVPLINLTKEIPLICLIWVKCRIYEFRNIHWKW